MADESAGSSQTDDPNKAPPASTSISFGFKKTKTSVLKPAYAPAPSKNREYIKSINDGAIEATVKKEKEEARVIPMPTSTNSYQQRLKAASSLKAEAKTERELPSDVSQLSLDERAVLEIHHDLLQKADNERTDLHFVIPKVDTEKISAKEASMDDYENVPILGYGLAMLRGMGLKEEDEGKLNDDKVSKTDEFKFRPKGMGLGADQTIKPKELKIKLKPGQVLTMKKGAFVVVLGGNYKDFYGEGKVPTGIKFIDFQVARYVSPVLDLVYFIFSSTDKEFRDDHYDDLIKTYHQSLSCLLKQCGEVPDQIFSYDALQKELKRFGRFGIPMAFMLIPVTTMQSQDLPDMDEMAEMMEKMKSNGGVAEETEESKAIMEKYAQQSIKVGVRVRNVALDMERLGYI